MASAIIVAYNLAPNYKLPKEKILDLAIWLIIGGLIGARLYEIFLEFPYYHHNPEAIIKIWQGGLAIHGGIIGGALTLLIFSKYYNLSALKLGAISVTGLSIGQAIGRWGNWFNQELFGLPSKLPWSIPIELNNRPLAYINSEFFQPTFLYESIGCLLIFIILLFLNNKWKNKLNRNKVVIIISTYLILYSVLRFSLEFIKIDQTPIIFSLRWPQIMSLIIIFSNISYIVLQKKK